MKMFFSFENSFINLFDWIDDISIEVIQKQKKKTLFDYMREIAEDVEFEEIKTVHEDRETNLLIQGVE